MAVRVGLLQMNCSGAREQNLARVDALIRLAAGKRAQVVLLSEFFHELFFIIDLDGRYSERAEPISGPIADIPAIVKEAQVIARGMIRCTGECAFVDQPIRFSTYPELPAQAAPTSGEHTQAVLVECGYSLEEISAMKAEGAI